MKAYPISRLLCAFLTIVFANTMVSGQGAGASDPGAGVAKPETQFIKLEAGAVTEVGADKDTIRARFPVSLHGVETKDVTLRIVKVTLDGQLGSEFVDAFNPPSIELPTPGRFQAILIEWNLTKSPPKQGTYTVSIEAAAMNVAKPLPFELQIKVPAAKLRTPKTLIIQQVRPFLFFQGNIEAPALDLRETTGRSRLTNIDISKIELFNDKGEPIAGPIEFKAPKTIAPDHSEPITYELSGSFPLGTSKGALEVRSPQLAEALPINFEVRTRLTKWIIFLVIGIGLLVGNIVRFRLKRKIEKDEATLKAIELDTRIRQEIERHRDEPFRAQLGATLETLNTAVKNENADAITKGTADANTALTDALNDLKQRRLAVEASFSQIAELTETKWSVPPSVATVLAEASDALKTIRKELNNDNVNGSRVGLQKLRSDLASKLGEPIRQWKDFTSQYLTNSLGDPGIVLPATVIQRLRQAVDAVNLKVQAISEINPGDTAEQIKTALGTLHSAHTNALQLADDLKLFLRTALSDVVAALGPAIVDQAALDRLRERLEGLGDTLDLGVERPDQAIGKLPNDLLGLDKAWSEALFNQLPSGASEAQRKAVGDRIAARDYLGAARLIFPIFEQNKRAASEGRVLGSVPGGEAAAGSGAATVVEPWMARAAMAAAPAVFLQTLREEGAAVPLEVLRIRTARELILETSLLNVLLGILLSLGGYFLFAEKFVGTPQELAAVFFWAFGVDITIDALSQTAKGVKKP